MVFGGPKFGLESGRPIVFFFKGDRGVVSLVEHILGVLVFQNADRE